MRQGNPRQTALSGLLNGARACFVDRRDPRRREQALADDRREHEQEKEQGDA